MKQTVILTGASGNLGSAVLSKLQNQGYHVIGTVNSQRSADRLAKNRIQAISLDLTDEEAMAQLLAQHAESLEGAVLTVGGFALGGFETTDEALLDKMFTLNFKTSFFLVKALLPLLEKKGGGQIVLLGSRPALEANEGLHSLAYALSKGLIFHLAELVNTYGKGKNISATVVVPSIIDSQVNRESMPEADFSTWVSPESVADTILFLFSPSGKQIREGIVKVYNNA